MLITHLLLILEVCNAKPTHTKSWAKNLLMLDLTFGPSVKVKRWFTGFGKLSFRWIQICIGSPMRRSSYYYKDRPTWFQQISHYFYEVTQTRMLPYCFECMIALVKADDFTTNIQSSNLKQHFVFQRAVITCLTPSWFYAHRWVFVHCALPVFIIQNKTKNVFS